MNTKTSIMNKDFMMVVIGQIISLFGNAILRFALPLYLLNTTGSAALFGIVSAVAFIPMILLCPIGGIIADRVNKRNVMVILDFTTAIISAAFLIMLGKVDTVSIIIITMILLYGIQGAYQPSVSASIPVLVPENEIMRGNAVINIVNSISTLIGPVIGGVIFGFAGIRPILIMSAICFTFSAVMEIFIKIPFKKIKAESNIVKTGIADMKESMKFMLSDNKIILKMCFVMAAINLILSACVIIGLPVIVTDKLGFEEAYANRMYGYIEAGSGAGSLLGGLLAGVFAKKVKIRNLPLFILICGATLIPIGAALMLNISGFTAYIIIYISIVVMMSLAAFCSIQMITYLQMITPEHMMGKIISCATCICMCASPLGQALYGAAFEYISSVQYIFMAAFLLVALISIFSIKSFANMEKRVGVSAA